MSGEIQKFRGRLVERQREARRLDMLIKGSVLALRNELDPFRASEDLNGEMIAELALQLGDLEIQLKSVLAEVAALRRALE